jgi:mRNA interferase HigB
MAWYRQVQAANWSTPANVKAAIGSAIILKDGRAVFNIAGNKYRIVVWINYPYRVVYIRFVGTHTQYDAIDAQTI